MFRAFFLGGGGDIYGLGCTMYVKHGVKKYLISLTIFKINTRY
jgi:hypothetical protein